MLENGQEGYQEGHATVRIRGGYVTVRVRGVVVWIEGYSKIQQDPSTHYEPVF